MQPVLKKQAAPGNLTPISLCRRRACYAVDFLGRPRFFGGADVSFGGLPRRFGGASVVFGGRPRFFGGADGSFGGLPRRFGGADGSFGGLPRLLGAGTAASISLSWAIPAFRLSSSSLMDIV